MYYAIEQNSLMFLEHAILLLMLCCVCSKVCTSTPVDKKSEKDLHKTLLSYQKQKEHQKVQKDQKDRKDQKEKISLNAADEIQALDPTKAPTPRIVLKNTCVNPWHKNQRSFSKLYSWAIISLTHPLDTMINKRNFFLARYLQRYQPPSGNVTVVFFCEGTFDVEQLSFWQSQFAGLAKFKVINTTNLGVNGTFGYNYMCKLFAVDIFEYIKLYDYYWRLDSDCFLFQIYFNIFEWVETQNVEYGYVHISTETHLPTLATLPLYVNNYTANCSVSPKALLGEAQSHVLLLSTLPRCHFFCDQMFSTFYKVSKTVDSSCHTDGEMLLSR